MARALRARVSTSQSSNVERAAEHQSTSRSPAVPRATRKRKRDSETSSIEVKTETVPAVHVVPPDTPPKKRRSKTVTKIESTDIGIGIDNDKDLAKPQKIATPSTSTSKPKSKSRSKHAKTVESDQEQEPSQDQIAKPESDDTKPKRKRKTKEEKDAETMPLAARTLNHRLTIGAHVSSAGGVHNAVTNSLHLGANAFALFLKSQRKWANPPLADEHASMFHANCTEHSYDPSRNVVPHGSYLVNLAHTDPTRTTQAYESFLDDLHRCQKLGIKLYNFHPGNIEAEPKSTPFPERRRRAIAHLAQNLNRAHAATASTSATGTGTGTGTVITLLENMAAKGSNTLGSTPSDIADTIALITDKSRVGFCLDTCHAFASGLDLRDARSVDETLTHLDAVIGLKYLRALHMNDSKAPFDSGRDLHANIGTGFIGLRGFHALVNDERVQGLPMVLETPIQVRSEDDGGATVLKDEKGKEREDKGIWAREIKLLESLVGMDVESAEFRKLETGLAAKGIRERERVEEQVLRRKDNKVKKAEKEAAGKKGRKKGGKKMEEGSDDSDLSEEE